MNWRLINRRILAAVVVLILSCGVLVTAAVQPAYAQAFNFTQISVTGNQRIETASIRNFAAIPLKKPVTGGQVNAAYQRLIATGLFEEVTVTPNGNTLVITVREFPTINRINFERNKRLKDDKLAEVISSQPRHVYSPALAEADAAAIVEAYRQAGRLTAEVRPVIIRRSDNRVDLVFEIFEGKVIEIQRISFVGNRQFSDRRLRQALGTKQAGIFRAFVRSDTFVADRIEFDKQVLRDFYSNRGYIDFQVLSVVSEVARERNGFFLTFKVREGQTYDFGALTTSSEVAEIDPADYQGIIRLNPGVTYSPAHVDTTVARMEGLATQRGLNFIRVEPRVTRNDRNRTLDVEFVLVRGPRIFVERIDIEGNDTTLDRVIRRQFKTVEGDPFNPREIRAAAARIQALGFFAVSNVTTRPGSSDDRLIVDVDVEDQPTGSLSFGVTYGQDSGVGGSISLSENNFLGKGQYVKAEFSGGLSSRNTELAFAEPAFLNRNLRLGFDAFWKTTTQAAASYDTLALGFAPSLGFPVSSNSRVNIRYKLASVEINNVDTDASTIISGDAGTVTSSTAKLTYSFDNRTSGLNPNAGFLVRISQEIAGLGGSSRYSKTTSTISAQSVVGNGDVVLKATIEAGALISFGGDTRVTDRFFLTSDQLRGFAQNGVGPRDNTATNTDALGGNMFAVARVEASFPVGLPEEYGIYGGLFMDVGSVWSLDNTTGTAGTVDDSAYLRAVVGVSVFWDTPIGPLRFNFSRVIRSQSYDNAENFGLTIDTRF